MGNGGFATNESMHWKVAHSDDPNDLPTYGRDPIPVDQIGEGSNGQGGSAGKGHKGYLRVRLRFTGTAGRASLAKLVKDLATNPPTDDYELDVTVPIIRRTRDEIERGTKGEWEVRVDW